MDSDLRDAVIDQESAGNPYAESEAGAQGLMQIMPENSAKLAPGEDIFDPEVNTRVGSQIYDEEEARFGGDRMLALAAYNAGPKRVKKAIAKAGSTDFEDISPYLPQQTQKYVPSVMQKYYARKNQQREENVDKQKDNYLAPWGTKEEFAQSLQDVLTAPGFNELPITEQIQKLDTVYGSKKWATEADGILSAVTDRLWEGAPEQAPDWDSMIGRPVEGETPEEIAKSADSQKKIFKDGLREKGVTPELFGSQIDRYFDSVSREEQARAEVRNRSWLGSAAAAGEEVARGVAQGVASPIAAVPDLLGYEETGKTIRDLPNKYLPENRDFYFVTDENGAVVRDDNGLPMTKMRGQVLSGVGQLGSMLIGGGGLRAAGAGVRGIGAFFGGVNGLTAMDGAYTEAREEGATRGEALEAGALALPGAFVDSAVDATIFGSGQFWMKGLTGANKARALAQGIAGAAVKSGAAQALQEDLSQRAVGYVTGKEYDPQRTLVAGVTGAVAGGLLGASEGYHFRPDIMPGDRTFTRYDLSSLVVGEHGPEEQAKLPAPEAANRLPENTGNTGEAIQLGQMPNAETQQELARKFEKFQQSTDSEMVLTLGKNEDLPPDMLNLFAFHAERDANGSVRVTKESSYEPREIDEKNLDAVSNEIQSLSKEISESPDPEDAADLVTRRAELKQEISKLEKRIPQEESADTNSLAALRRDTQNKINANRIERKRTNDKVLQQVLDSEHADLQKTWAQTNAGLSKQPEKRRIVEARQELAEVNDQLKQLAPRDYFNNLKAKEARLQDLLRKRSDLKQSQEGGFAHAEPFRDAAIKIESNVPWGEDRYVMPLRDKWYVLDRSGRVLSEGGPLLHDAVRVARQVPRKFEKGTASTPIETPKRQRIFSQTPGEGLKMQVTRKRALEDVFPARRGPTAEAQARAAAELNSGVGNAVPNAQPQNEEQPVEQQNLASSQESFTRVRQSPANKTVSSNFTREGELTKTGTQVRDVQSVKRDAINALKSLVGRRGIPATFSEGGAMRSGNGTRTLGYFNRAKEFLRIGRINDILTIGHEIAHVVDKYTFGKWDSLGTGEYDKLDPKVKAGLLETADTFYHNAHQLDEDTRVKEGFTMFIQHLASGQPVHKDVLQWFRNDFANAFPEEYKALNTFVNAAFEYYNQTPQNFVRQFRSAKDAPAAVRAMSQLTSNFHRDWFDYAVALSELDRVGGTNVKDWFDSRRNISAPYAHYVMNKGISDLSGNILSKKSLGSSLEPIIKAGKQDLLSDYMASKRAVSYVANGLEPGLNMEDAGRVILDTEKNHPEVAKAAHDFWDQWSVLQEALSRDSRMARDYFNGLIQQNLSTTGTQHGFYVPFVREGKGDRVALGAQRTGSTRRIKDPLLHIQAVVQGLAEAVSRRNVLEQLINSAQDPTNPSGAYVREITDHVKKNALTAELNSKKEQIAKQSGIDAIDPTSNEAINASIGFLSPSFSAVKASEGYKILAVPDQTRTGSMRYYEVADNIHRVFNNKLPEWTSAPLFNGIVRWPTQVVKLGATTLRPAFALTNLGRDLLTAYRRSSTWNPITFGRDVLMGLNEATKSAAGLDHLAQWADLSERMGLTGSNRFRADVQEKVEGKSWKMHPIKKLEDMISISERGIRLSAMMARARELGIDINKELSPQQAVELALAYKRSTTDFAVQGEKARVANAAIPFFTARIAETVQMAQDLKRNKAKVAALGTAWATYGMMYALAHRDDDWYKEMSSDELSRFAHLPWEHNGKQMLLRVPLDSWASMWFTLGQGVAQGAAKRGELHKNALAFASSVIKGNLPLGTPIDKGTFTVGSISELGGPIVKEILQQYVNRDFYFDNPIVPKALEEARPQDQVTQATTAFAKEIGQLTGYSPARIDHIIRSTAAVGADAIRFAEHFSGAKLDPNKREGAAGLIDYAMGPLFRYGSTNSIFDTSSQQFYDDVAKFQANKDVETPREKRARLKLNDAKERIGAINTMLTTDLSQEEKDDLLAKKKALFAEARQIVAGETGEPLTSAPKSQAERVKKERRLAVAGKREAKAQEIFE